MKSITIKIYKAILTQSGTNDPVATVLNGNDSNYLNIVWTRNGNGSYLGTYNGITNTNTIPHVSGAFADTFGVPGFVNDANSLFVGLNQKWNDKWTTHVRYVNTGMDSDNFLAPNGADIRISNRDFQVQELGVGVTYQYNSAMSFSLFFFAMTIHPPYNNPSSPSIFAMRSDNKTSTSPTRDWKIPTAVAILNFALARPLS